MSQSLQYATNPSSARASSRGRQWHNAEVRQGLYPGMHASSSSTSTAPMSARGFSEGSGRYHLGTSEAMAQQSPPRQGSPYVGHRPSADLMPPVVSPAMQARATGQYVRNTLGAPQAFHRERSVSPLTQGMRSRQSSAGILHQASGTIQGEVSGTLPSAGLVGPGQRGTVSWDQYEKFSMNFPQRSTSPSIKVPQRSLSLTASDVTIFDLPAVYQQSPSCSARTIVPPGSGVMIEPIVQPRLVEEGARVTFSSPALDGVKGQIVGRSPTTAYNPMNYSQVAGQPSTPDQQISPLKNGQPIAYVQHGAAMPPVKQGLLAAASDDGRLNVIKVSRVIADMGVQTEETALVGVPPIQDASLGNSAGERVERPRASIESRFSESRFSEISIAPSILGEGLMPTDRSMITHWKSFWQDFQDNWRKENPEDPFDFLKKALESRDTLQRVKAKVNQEDSRSLFKALMEDTSEPSGLLENLVDIIQDFLDSEDDLEIESPEDLLHVLHWLGMTMSENEKIDEADFFNFVEEAVQATAINLEAKEPHLMLNFDVNQTVIMLDSVAGVSESDCVNVVLADCAWGKHHVTKDDPIGYWVLARNKPETHCPEKGLISYSDFVDKTNPLPKDKNDRDGVSKVRKTKKRLQTSFTSRGQPGEAWIELHKDMMNALTLPADVIGSKAADEAGLEGTSVLLLPSFINMLIELKSAGRSFTLLFRTYGLDLGKIMKELNAICEGRHPCHKGAPRLDGSDGEPDYRMSLDSAARSGTWYRELDDSATGGLIALIMGTVAQPSEKPQPGDLLGIPFYEQLKSAKGRENKKAQSIDGKSKPDTGISILVNKEALDKYVEFCKPQTIALRDFFPAWHLAGKKSRGGKPLFIDSANLANTFPIFFDDHIHPDNAKIVDARSSRAYLAGKPGYIDIKESYNFCLIQAEPLHSISNPRYFMDKIDSCERQHRELLRKRAQAGSIVQRLLELSTDEIRSKLRDIKRAKPGQERRVSLPLPSGAESMSSALGLDSPTFRRRKETFQKDDDDYGEDIANALGAVKVIGLTSDIASGRNLVLEMLQDSGAITICCLNLKKQICRKGSICHKEVASLFIKWNASVTDQDGEINHLTLAGLIAQNPELRKAYESVMKPHVRDSVAEQIRELDEACQVGIYYTEDPWMCRRVVVVDSGDIFDSGLHHLCEEVWLVESDFETRVQQMANMQGLFNESQSRYVVETNTTKGQWEHPPQVTIRYNNNLEELRKQVCAEFRKLHVRMYGLPADSQEIVLEVSNPEDTLIGAAPISYVWKKFLWHRMVFVILRHQKSGGFLATQRSMSKEYMPGRWDFAVFGKPTTAAVPVGSKPEEVAAQALKDKLGVLLPLEGFSKVTTFVYRGALSSLNKSGGRTSFLGYVYEAFLDIQLSTDTLPNKDEVQDIKVFTASESLAMMQEELVPMTARAFDVYIDHFMVGEGIQRLPNLVATPGAEPFAREDVLTNQEPWTQEVAQYCCGVTLVGLGGEEFSSRREVGEILSELGAIVIDCQSLSKRCVEKGTACFNEIEKAFGDIVVGEDGEVNTRLLGPMLLARPEMLARFQMIIQKNLLETLRQRISAIQEQHAEVWSIPGGKLHTVRKVVVIDCSVLKECGMEEFVDEEWWVVNNYDSLTRRRILGAEAKFVDEMPNIKKRSLRRFSSQGLSLRKVTFKVKEVTKLRSDVLDQWCALHQRMHEFGQTQGSEIQSPKMEKHPKMERQTSSVFLEGADEGKEPFISISSATGDQIVGVAPISLVREMGLAHKTLFVVLRSSTGGSFYSMRRKPQGRESQGKVDLAFNGPPGIRELRTGEHPEDAAARIMRTILGIETRPCLIGDLSYQDTNRDGTPVTGLIFEVVVDIPLTELRPNRGIVQEVMMLDSEARIKIPKEQLATLTSSIFAHFWSLRMGSDNTLMFPQEWQRR